MRKNLTGWLIASGESRLYQMLLLLCCLPGLLQARDVKWLPEVTRAPQGLSADQSGKLLPLLQDRSGNPITSLEGWQQQRIKLRAEWLDFLGTMPDPRPPVRLQTLQEECVGSINRKLVRYEGEPGLFVEGYLLLPQEFRAGKLRLPGIVALHQTTDSSIDEIAGVSGPAAMHIGLKLAKRGFVVFCPRCFLWQNATSLDEAVAQHRKRHPQTLGMAKMLYDAMRGTDVLESLDGVDATRIGAIGHSLGAKEVLYLAAFDERIKAAVASEGGLGFSSTNWDAPWYLSSAIHEAGFTLNHHQLLGLIAPRPFLVLGGEAGSGAADGDRSWTLLEAAYPVWKLSGEPVRLGLLNHRQGHAVSSESFERMAEWLENYLTK